MPSTTTGTPRLGGFDHRADVGHLKLRIGNDFQGHQSRLRANGGRHVGGPGHVDIGHRHSPLLQRLLEQRIRVAEQVVRGHDVRSGPSQGKHHVGNGRHARGEGQDARCVGQRADPLFQLGDGRVGDAGVGMRQPSPFERLLHLTGRLELEGHAIVDGRAKRPVRVAVLARSMNGLRGKPAHAAQPPPRK